MLSMTAVLQQVPPDHRGGYDLEQTEITVQASTYESALGDLTVAVPAGWRVLHIRVDREIHR